ncbi:MAG: SRPBCC family protein [Gammaproteobacteria bacterium]|nr:SRPBCC family protein [Gammaproteobacteria bacterium]
MNARILMLWLAGVGAAWAGEVLDVGVERIEQRYAVDIDARFNTPAERLRVLLTDYPNLARINDSIQRSEVLEKNAPQQHCVRTEAHVCVGLFCKTIVQVQDVGVQADGTILATLRPQGSDFSYGIARWQFWEEPTGTRMRFHSEIEPAFWVPPIIGPWLIQRALRAETLKSVANLERLAESPTESIGP